MLWAFLTSWLTPASLFLLLNLVIGFIALTSRLTAHHRPPPPPQAQSQENQHYHLPRAPSSLLERVRSVNFSLYRFPSLNLQTQTTSSGFLETAPEPEHRPDQSEPTRLERAPSLLERVTSIKFGSFYRSEPEKEAEPEPEPEPGSDLNLGHVSRSGPGMEQQVKRSKSESRVAPGRDAKEKMKKSASESSVAVEDEAEEEEEEEMVERRRPETTRVERTVSFGDEGVDAKADDFINRFKQQLKLQRLDSLLRYKEMLKGKQKV